MLFILSRNVWRGERTHISPHTPWFISNFSLGAYLFSQENWGGGVYTYSQVGSARSSGLLHCYARSAGSRRASTEQGMACGITVIRVDFRDTSWHRGLRCVANATPRSPIRCVFYRPGAAAIAVCIGERM